ncbi:inter-alpha-trypsin inhibitor heavy chain H5-like [Mytilus californianus]|uniref:inter-alpha-trypsin inhibitor heavy chain H5-like n=1 Tax=Mytilus californianus TaxID=6549 RepID=UPI002245AEC6|nr:inter-alpha-trypsin inhibitor heavy chain H5-like [Mytilus californianus]
MSIKETKPLTKLELSPMWKNAHRDKSKELHLTRPSNESAVITYNVVSNQMECLQKLEVQYDVERSQNAGEILIEDGFFVHFLAPTGLQVIPKDIVFVLDTSRSMTGEPIAELQNAMVTILGKLALKDMFNIVVFESSFGMFESELQKVTNRSITDAKNMIYFMTPDGGTNIHDGLLAGIKILHSVKVDEIRSPIIIFLTDGKASSGITNRNLITKRVKSRNILGIPIFTISLGKESDQNLTSKIASQNFGFSRHIYNAGTSSSIIDSVYDDVATTLMKHINIVYMDNVVNDQTVTQTNFKTLFQNTEIVTSGKFQNESTKFLNSTVVGLGASGLTMLSNASVSVIDDDGRKNTIEAIWKHRRLKEVMSIQKAIDDSTMVKALQETLLTMSVQYKYVTPLTAVLIERHGKPESNVVLDNEERVVYAVAHNQRDQLKENKPKRRDSEFSAKGDPHFEIRIEGIENPICFDIKTDPGSIVRILQIPRVMVVNIGIIPETEDFKEDKMYISDIFVSIHAHTLLMNIDGGILYNGQKFDWPLQNCTETTTEKLIMCSNNKRRMTVFHLNHEVTLRVKRVIHVGKKYFNFYIDNFTKLSKRSTGLLGEILQETVSVRKVIRRKGRLVGSFTSRSNRTGPNKYFSAKLKLMENSETRHLCWHLHKKISGLIDSSNKFQLPSLFHSDVLPT